MMRSGWLLVVACTLGSAAACDSGEDEPGTEQPDAQAPEPDGSTPADAASADASGSADAALDASPGDAALADAGSPDAAAGDPLEQLRQVCVDTINTHRATLGLPPLKRATKEQEACSDRGAKKDGDSNNAHSSAGSCSGLGAQNTCPSWRYGQGTGNATLEAALKRCLQQMWDEGMPPVPVKTCIADKACFPKYGHWINMSSSDAKVVSCGFYDMGKNTYWMNQDFGR